MYKFQVPPAVRETRALVLEGPLGLAEIVGLDGVGSELTPASYTPVGQLVFPLASAFFLVEGREARLCDPNQIGVIRPGAVTCDRTAGYAAIRSLVLAPAQGLVEEVESRGGEIFLTSPLSRPASARAQRLAALVSARGRRPGHRLFVEEALIDLVRAAAETPRPAARWGGGRSARLVAAVKEILAEADAPLSLSAIAGAVGASPTYLTDLFRRAEGVPISRYQTRLRLARALDRLPHTEDITALALDLGFSSHSHFSAAFKDAFGVSPSLHRAQSRGEA